MNATVFVDDRCLASFCDMLTADMSEMVICVLECLHSLVREVLFLKAGYSLIVLHMELAEKVKCLKVKVKEYESSHIIQMKASRLLSELEKCLEK